MKFHPLFLSHLGASLGTWERYQGRQALALRTPAPHNTRSHCIAHFSFLFFFLSTLCQPFHHHPLFSTPPTLSPLLINALITLSSLSSKGGDLRVRKNSKLPYFGKKG